jgi:FkbM family methyltransferase
MKIKLTLLKIGYKIYSWIARALVHAKIIDEQNIYDLIFNTVLAIPFVDSLVKSHLNSVFKINGHKMFLSKRFLFVSLGGVYEPMITLIIQNHVKRGDIVLDIGAHIGYHTLAFAKLVGDKGIVYAFEPDPDNFGLLKKNIEMNDYNNIISEQAAISNKTGKILLYLSKYNEGDHQIYDSKEDRDHIEVRCLKLDDYFKNRKININFIKMDIQGAEGLATEGMATLLDTNNHLKMIIEFWPAGLKKSGIEPDLYLQKLHRYGFKFMYINETSKTIEPITIPILIEQYINNTLDNSFINLLLVKDSSFTNK